LNHKKKFIKTEEEEEEIKLVYILDVLPMLNTTNSSHYNTSISNE